MVGCCRSVSRVQSVRADDRRSDENLVTLLKTKTVRHIYVPTVLVILMESFLSSWEEKLQTKTDVPTMLLLLDETENGFIRTKGCFILLQTFSETQLKNDELQFIFT